jgi:hypothetical protein
MTQLTPAATAERTDPHPDPASRTADPAPLAHPPEDHKTSRDVGPLHVGVHFVAARERESWSGDGMLVVRMERLGAGARGRLAEAIEEAIEQRLAGLGGTSPGIGAAGDADDVLSDQLFRMRQVGVRTLGLAMGSLRAMTSAGGALEAGDSATLIFWARATRERPVVLLLDEGDASLGAHVTPIPLVSALLPRVPVPVPASVSLRADKGGDEPAPADDACAAPAATTTSVATTTSAPATTTTASPSRTPEAPTPPVAAPGSLARLAGASVAHDDDAWRTWTLALSAARGPQPLVAFERLFTQSYLPLCNTIASGLGDARARNAHDEFRRNFARVYTEACPAFAVTGKRPRMVLDAPDLAARIARLHGARTTQLLLVDGMRYDLGAMVKTSLARALGARGSLTDETLLWSALPTNTARQLTTLGRGSEALREAPVSEREPEPMRGRTVETIRRVKIGSRDVYKLDLGEARLRDATTHALAALPGIAEAIADVIARHAATLAARTLLFVFGDHGFTIEPDGTTRHGGASPEEVLVPGYAFLIADVH